MKRQNAIHSAEYLRQHRAELDSIIRAMLDEGVQFAIEPTEAGWKLSWPHLPVQTPTVDQPKVSA